MSAGRIDHIIAQLQRLYEDAQGIMNAYVEMEISGKPGVSFGVAKTHLIAEPAGLSIDYIEALKVVKKGMK